MRRQIIPYDPRLKELARQLRNNSTPAEIRLWSKLKGKQRLGFDFHRQKPIHNFILDFFCHELMLGIELDGYSHTLEQVNDQDERKNTKLKQLGIHLLRFKNNEIFEDVDAVILSIDGWIENNSRICNPV